MARGYSRAGCISKVTEPSKFGRCVVSTQFRRLNDPVVLRYDRNATCVFRSEIRLNLARCLLTNLNRVVTFI